VLLRHNKYLLVFLLIYVWIFGFATFVGFYFEYNTDRFTQGFTDYVLCNAAKEEHCENTEPIPIWIIYVDIVNYTNVGTYVLVCFGGQKKILQHWKQMFIHISKGEFRELSNLSIEGTVKTIVKVTIGANSKKVTTTMPSNVDSSVESSS